MIAFDQRNSYSLLADDRGNWGEGTEDMRRLLRAHLILQSLTNNSVTVPDSYAINNPNLRVLMRSDATVRSLLSEGILRIAVRENADGERTRLQDQVEQHAKNGSLRDAVKDIPLDGLAFADSEAQFLGWQIESISKSYTRRSKVIVETEETMRILGEDCVSAILEHITDVLGGVLTRNFFHFEALDILAKRGFDLSQEQFERLKLCGEAPYKSNIPSVLGLNPAYDVSDRTAFEVMRGVAQAPVDFDTPRKLSNQLDFEHFVEGLCRLDFETIQKVRDSFEFKIFLKSFQQRADPDLLEDCFFELDAQIQREILAAFPNLQRRRAYDHTREIQKQYHEIVGDKRGAVSDLISFSISAAGLSAPGIGLAASHIVDFVSDGVSNKNDPPQAPNADHSRQMNTLKQYLKSKGMAEKLETGHEVVETSTHASETFVSNS